MRGNAPRGTQVQARIADAILDRRLVEVRSKGLTRVLEPYLLTETKAGDVVLHGRQVRGEWVETPPPDWCDLRLEDIDAVTVLDERYEHPHPDYNPDSKKFYRVIVHTARG